MGQLSLVVDPNALHQDTLQTLVDTFNSLPRAMKFLNMQGSPLSGAITITDNLARPAVSDGNRKAFASGGYRAFDQKKGGMAIVFNSNPPDNKPLLNTLIHEIGHIKWPGLGNDSEKHDPLFYALLNNALQKLGVSVDPQQDLQGQSIENVKIPQKAIDDPLSYIINNNRSELVPGIDSAQAAGDRWGGKCIIRWLHNDRDSIR
ncbi:hypothetical protein MKK68_23030 [Methylobacterium sp. E-016]|uniref:hypothetical protein n=1 Tax=Methylobacterium sp. E-016 TaxID=2836556 RepID=UPI001FB867D4|nr:hypothetical protein [Methylobacterium sp. E-016]MCJ2078483.1 hypothetical protein [Methylobacterium sp. E-016]